MKIEAVYEKVNNMFLENNLHGFYMIKDVGDAWVFYGGNPDEEYYGIRTISCDKETDKTEWFNSNV